MPVAYDSLVDLPGVSTLIKKLIAGQVSQLCVLPNSLFIPLSEEADKPTSPCKLPSGMLRVQVIQALGLEAKDKYAFTGKSSDPYVIFSINGNGPEVKVTFGQSFTSLQSPKSPVNQVFFCVQNRVFSFQIGFQHFQTMILLPVTDFWSGNRICVRF